MKYRKYTGKPSFLLGVLTLALLLPLLTQPALAAAYTPEVSLTAKAYYLYNLDTETVIAAQNEGQKLAPASLTKMMTCVLALENTPDLDAEKCVYPNYVQDYLYQYQWVDGNGAVSLGGLNAGEELSMRQLLYACMLPSANEAAMIIADHIGGSQEGFVQMMNQRARELGMSNTTFVNANGLYAEGHLTTAKDMATLALHAMELPGFMDIVTTASYDSGPTNMRDNVTWSTTIKMQVPEHSLYYPGLQGIKTGSVPEAGDCFVSTCTRDGFTYLLVIMGSEYLDANGNALAIRGSFVDAKALYDWVFDNFRRKSLVEKGSYESEAKLELSLDKDHIRLMAGERFTYLMPKSMDVDDVVKEADIPESVDAPVTKGDYIGELKLKLGGEEIGSVPLLAAESVHATAWLVFWDKVKDVMGSFWFKFLAILAVLLIIFYVVIMILRNRNRRRRNYRPRRRI